MSLKAEPGNTGSEFLDSLVGKDGLKTDLDIHFPEEELWKAGFTIFAAGSALILFGFAVGSIIKKLKHGSTSA